jgi:hypothetical protein
VRRGYPFLGNDFFAEMGDVFACHAIDNPDQSSEMDMLRSYAPDLEVDTIRSLSTAFMDLRALQDSGQLLYPYVNMLLVLLLLCLLLLLRLNREPDELLSVGLSPS